MTVWVSGKFPRCGIAFTISANQFHHIYLSGMVLKPVRLLCEGLFTWRWGTPGRWGNPLRWGNPPVYISYWPIEYSLFSHNLWTKTRNCAGLGSFQHKVQHCCFQLTLMFVGFDNQSSLLTRWLHLLKNGRKVLKLVSKMALKEWNTNFGSSTL